MIEDVLALKHELMPRLPKGIPIVAEDKARRARFVRLELGKFGSYPVEISELRLFPPLER